MANSYSTKSKEELLFWAKPKTEDLYKMVTKGDKVEVILEKLTMKEDTYVRYVGCDFFQRRLKNWINAKEISDYMYARIQLRDEFLNRMAEATDDLIVKAFLAMSIGATGKKSAILEVLKELKDSNPVPLKIDKRSEEELNREALEDTFGCPAKTNVKQEPAALAEGTPTSDQQKETD